MCPNVNDEMAYVYGAPGVALNGAVVVEPDVFLLSVALFELARSMKESAEVVWPESLVVIGFLILRE